MADESISTAKDRFELETELSRDLGLLEATTIIIGGIIGSSIFGAPAAIAEQLGSPGLIMLVWIVGGLLSFFGALCFAELGTMLPRTGGQVVYLRQAYPPIVAFLYGWTEVFVSSPSSIAAISIVFATYFGYFVPAVSPDIPLITLGGYMFSTQHTVILITLTFLGAVNYYGVRFGGFVQNLFTVGKVIGLGGLVLLAVSIGGDWGHFTPLFPKNLQFSLVGAFGASMIGATAAYNGWAGANNVTGELKDPRRMLPRAITIGLGLSTVVYLAVNWSYLYVMTVEEIATSPRIASDMATRLIGPIGGSLLSLAVMVSTFGTMNGGLLGSPRISYALAKEGLFPQWLTYVHPVYKTPSRCIVVITILSMIWTSLGSFQALIEAQAYVIYLFNALNVIAVFILRRKYPQAARPVKVWGYPVTPILFLGITTWYLSTILIFKTRETLPGLLCLIAGLPLYYIWFRKTKPTR